MYQRNYNLTIMSSEILRIQQNNKLIGFINLFDFAGLKSSRSGSVEHAIRDYARKVIQQGLATESEVQVWLN